MSYTTEDSYPLKGVALDCSTAFSDTKGRQGFETCIFRDSSLKAVKQYRNDTVIDSYLLIGKDTVNRFKNNKKTGRWMEYIPKIGYVRNHFYAENLLKYSYVVFVGNTINVSHNFQNYVVAQGDTIGYCCYDSIYCLNNPFPKPNNDYVLQGLYDKNNLHSLTLKNGKMILFYPGNKIAATYEFVNNEQIDSLYNEKGNLIYTCNHKTRDCRKLGKDSEMKAFDKRFNVFNQKIINFFLIDCYDYTEEELKQEIYNEQ